MKKFPLSFAIAIIVGFTALAQSAWFWTTEFEPIQISTNGLNGALTTYSRYTINKPSTSNHRNCITDVTVSATGGPYVNTFSIMEGPLTGMATAFMVDIATNPFTKSWPSDYPLCLEPGATGYFQIMGTSASWKINGRGFIKKP